MTEHSWWRQPMVILAHMNDLHHTLERDSKAIARLVRWKRRAGFDAEHLFLNISMLEGEGGDDSRAYLFKNFHGYREDWLARYLPIARGQGLRVIVYFNCHWFKRNAFPADHFVVDAADQPKVIYGDGLKVCARGPFRAWSERIAEDLGRYAIDGVFLDGPIKDACWCPTCRTEFQTRYGVPLPETSAACPTALADAYAAFLRTGTVGYIEAFSRGLRKHNPEAILYCNGGDDCEMKDSLAWTQLVGEEGGFIGYKPLNGVFPFRAGRAAKLLECRARGRGRVIFCDSGFKKYDYHVLPRGEVARMYAGTIANGASPWFLIFRSVIRADGSQAVLRFNRLVREHRAALGGDSLAEAALLHSPHNFKLAGAARVSSGDDVNLRANAAQRMTLSRHAEEFDGVYAALSRSGYPFDVLEEDNVMNGEWPARIKLLILPGVGSVSDAFADRLRRFVAGGGRLLATFDSSLYDEQGRRRPDFALADVFGAHIAGDLIGPSDLDYLAVTSRHVLTEGLSQKLLPCPEYWLLVTPDAKARTPLHYLAKMSRRYAALPPVSKHGAAVVNRYGKGRVVLFPSALGALSLIYRFPDTRRLILNAARLLAGPPVSVEGGDEFIETTLRRGADGGVVVHLLNWAMGERPSSSAIPMGPLRVRVRLPPGARRPPFAHLCWAGRKVRCSSTGDGVSFVVPGITEYEMVRLPGD